MYVGGTGVEALHHLVFEVIDNAVDEAMAGACTKIEVSLEADGSVTIIDNGRGIPAGLHPEKKRSTLELVFTELHTGGKFGSGGYSTSGGLHGVGVKATNALSSWLSVETHRDGVVYRQHHKRGLPTGAVGIYTLQGQMVGNVDTNGYEATIKGVKAKKQKTQTVVSFQPNPEFLDTIDFDFETVAHRLQEIAFQIPTVTTILTDKRRVDKDNKHPAVKYRYKGGLVQWVEFLNTDKDALHKEAIHVHEVIETEDGKGGKVSVDVELAMQYHTDVNSAEGVIISTVNTIPTPDGGKHVSGFRAGLTKAINTFATEKRMAKKGNVSGKDVLYGLTAIVKLLMPDPQFTSQTKTQLASDYVQGVANSLTYNALLEAFRKSPALGRTVVQQSQAAAQARQAEAKVRASIMRKSILEVSNLPGKLADCDSRTDPLLTDL
ncbi:MAG: ATP-binding protein [Chloroflexota bacterium]